MRELSALEMDAVSGGLSWGAVGVTALAIAAGIFGGIAIGFGAAGAAGVIGVDAAFGGSMGFGLMGSGFTGASIVAGLFGS